MTERPTGTVTFLFTDIEQSTKRWEEHPDAMRVALTRHDTTLKQAIESAGGWLFKHTGDGVVAAFTSARSAIDAAINAQRRLELPVRMGVCTGDVELRDADYFGPALNRAARIMAAGHGGQVVVAASTASMVSGADLIELGEHRLRDLTEAQRLYQVRAEGLKEKFPPLNTLSAAPSNLPAQATSFLGREKDLAEVVALLRTARLVTLTGVGGVGKTRLAVQVAGEVLPDYADGTWLVELSGLSDPAALGHALAAVLSVMQQPGKTIEQSIIAAISGRRLLLVLDNCEHMIEAAASMSHEIVAHCAEVTILATSREALMIDGERIWPVPSLGFREGVRSPAVELFVDRARAIVPEFRLGGDSDAVGDICRRLDGIPLAIELAAARIRSMSPSQICTRLNERFRLLTGGPRRALERHQTLRHTVQWSFDLLSQSERTLLSRASVFAGGFELKAAERVCNGPEFAVGDVLDLLDSLVRKSLVTVDRLGDVVRYGLLETIRQFAEEQLAALGESDTGRRRHAQYFAEDSTTQFEKWISPHILEAHEWIEREMDNVRAAFRWAADHQDIDIAATIAANTSEVARWRLRQEATNWAAEILDAARRIRHRRLVVLLTWATSNAWGLGQMDEAKRYGEEALSLIDDPNFDPFCWVCIDLAFVAMFEGHVDRAITLIRTGAEHASDRRARLCMAFIPLFLATGGRYDEAIEASRTTLPIVEATGFATAISAAHYAKGRALAKTDPEAALAAYERSAACARESGSRLFETWTMPEIATLQARKGDPIAALRSFRRMLEESRGSSDIMFFGPGFGGLVVLFDRLGLLQVAATLYGALVLKVETEGFIDELPQAIQHVRSALGNAEVEKLSQRGATMTVHEATDYAEEQIRLALAAAGASDV